MKTALLLLSMTCLGVSACAPISVSKTYTEEWTDPKTGKKITITETITQVPENRLPVHLKHPELYE